MESWDALERLRVGGAILTLLRGERFVMKFLDLSHTIEENLALLRSLPKPQIEHFFDCEQSMAFTGELPPR